MEKRVLYSDRHDAGSPGSTSLWNMDSVPDESSAGETPWQLKDRMKTTSVALALCLNIGTDPPPPKWSNVVKIDPCARWECWTNPFSLSRHKSLETIGNKLEEQYKGLQSRAIYKQLLDPTVEDLRSLCTSLRRRARGDRVLFHYNGHGVPDPTENGEIWLFSKDYKQYIPLSLNDLRANMVGSPAIYVLDCSSAGQTMPHFARPAPAPQWPQSREGSSNSLSTMDQSPRDLDPRGFTAEGDRGGDRGDLRGRTVPPRSPSRGGFDPSATPELQSQSSLGLDGEGSTSPLNPSAASRGDIVLVPCSAYELLPMEPQYPADLFTTCLTTPIPMALRWFVLENPLSMGGVDPECVASIPGKIGDRKTPLGELNWIFVAITDSIAWNVLPRALFQRLFRQDLLVASLFRNFLLADRIFRSLGCTPQSLPQLPSDISLHPLWHSWDVVVESALTSFAGLRIPPSMPPANSQSDAPDLAPLPVRHHFGASNMSSPSVAAQQPTSPLTPGGGGVSGFGSSDSLSSAGGGAEGGFGSGAASVSQSGWPAAFFVEQLTAFEVWLELGDCEHCPEQLPVVLQVLLSQAHRLRALLLLRRFFELGNHAVHLALSVGIFPYVLKLLQSPDPELRHVLVGIWARIVAFDPTCQQDLVSATAYASFMQHMGVPEGATVSAAVSEKHVNAAFILTRICDGYAPGQLKCLEQGLAVALQVFLNCSAPGAASVNGGHAQRDGPGGRGAHGDRMDSAHRHEAASQSSDHPLSPPSSHHGSSEPFPTTNPQVPLLRRWLCLCAAALCRGCPAAQRASLGQSVGPSSAPMQRALLTDLLAALVDPAPEVRAAAAYAVSCLVVDDIQTDAATSTPMALHPQAAPLPTAAPATPPTAATEQRCGAELTFTCLLAEALLEDGAPLVRRELALAMAPLAMSLHHRDGLAKAIAEAALRAFTPDPPDQAVDAATDCAICLDPLGSGTACTLQCAHSFHASCVEGMRRGQRLGDSAATVACPLCRAPLLPAPVAERPSQYRVLGRALAVLAVDPFPPVAAAALEVAGLACAEAGSVHEVACRAKVFDLVAHHGVYRWSAKRFEHRGGGGGGGGDGADASEPDALDPLTEKGARELYWQRRNSLARKGAADLAVRSSAALSKFREAAEKLDREGGPANPISPLAAILAHPSRIFNPGGGGGGTIGPGGGWREDGTGVPVPKEVALDATVVLENDTERTSVLLFHPMEPLLAVAADADKVSLWQYESGERWWHIRNGNPAGTRLTTMQWLNGAGPSRLLVGDDSGVVRVWDGVQDDGSVGGGGAGESAGSRADCGQGVNGGSGSARRGGVSDGLDGPMLVSSFRAASVDPGLAGGAGLAASYHEGSGLLFAGGHTPLLSLWDLTAEARASQWVADPTTRAVVSCLSCASPHPTADAATRQPERGLFARLGLGGESVVPELGGRVCLAGFSDGAVKLFDARLPASRNCAASWREHEHWVVSAHLSGAHGAVTGSVAGDVSFIDLRTARPVRTLGTLSHGHDSDRDGLQPTAMMSALAVHPAAPILAVGSHAQFIKVLTLDGYVLKWIKYHDGFLGQRIGPVACLAFHPNRAVMAAGATDSIISVYSSSPF